MNLNIVTSKFKYGKYFCSPNDVTAMNVRISYKEICPKTSKLAVRYGVNIVFCSVPLFVFENSFNETYKEYLQLILEDRIARYFPAEFKIIGICLLPDKEW